MGKRVDAAAVLEAERDGATVKGRRGAGKAGDGAEQLLQRQGFRLVVNLQRTDARREIDDAGMKWRHGDCAFRCSANTGLACARCAVIQSERFFHGLHQPLEHPLLGAPPLPPRRYFLFPTARPCGAS